MTTAAGHAAARAHKAAAEAETPAPAAKGVLARAGAALEGKGALIGAVALGAAGLAVAGYAAARLSAPSKDKGKRRRRT